MWSKSSFTKPFKWFCMYQSDTEAFEWFGSGNFLPHVASLIHLYTPESSLLGFPFAHIATFFVYSSILCNFHLFSRVTSLQNLLTYMCKTIGNTYPLKYVFTDIKLTLLLNRFSHIKLHSKKILNKNLREVSLLFGEKLSIAF